MRIWSLHPRYLDQKGLLACWRETLLAQKVLQGLTKGYRNHPQLDRFRACDQPLEAICAYLHGICDEADSRNYRFDRSKIVTATDSFPAQISVTRGQLAYELAFLKEKVAGRDRAAFAHRLADIEKAQPHPLFMVVEGEIEPWEKVKEPSSPSPA